MKVLIISPHPDDLELWAGGTAAKLVSEGYQVRSIILTDGRKSPRSFQCSDDEMAKIRKKEGTQAHQVLGIKDFEYFGLPNIKNEKLVEDILRKELEKEYDEIYMPDPGDAHSTHVKVAEMTLALARVMNIKSALWSYDGWNFLHNPDKFVEIEDFLPVKVKAIKCHKSQNTDKKYWEAMEKFARVRAILMDPHEITDVKYAEAFKKLN